MSQYFTNADEKLFIDLRLGGGYTNEIEKINRGDSDLSIVITVKAVTTKNEITINWRLSRQIFLLSLSL